MTMRNVLIAEDEPLIAMMLEDFLDAAGHKVAGTADSVAEAMKLVEAGGFDVAILDVNLRGDVIWPVADRLVEKNIPYILATGGHVTPPPAQHADAPVLAKPFTIDSVGPAVEAACGG